LASLSLLASPRICLCAAGAVFCRLFVRRFCDLRNGDTRGFDAGEGQERNRKPGKQGN